MLTHSDNAIRDDVADLMSGYLSDLRANRDRLDAILRRDADVLGSTREACYELRDDLNHALLSLSCNECPEFGAVLDVADNVRYCYTCHPKAMARAEELRQTR